MVQLHINTIKTKTRKLRYPAHFGKFAALCFKNKPLLIHAQRHKNCSSQTRVILFVRIQICQCTENAKGPRCSQGFALKHD